MSTKNKLSIKEIIEDLEEFLNKTDDHRSEDLSAIKRTLHLLNRHSVMRIGGKSVVILSDDEIELEQSNKKAPTALMEDYEEAEGSKYVSTGQVADYFEIIALGKEGGIRYLANILNSLNVSEKTDLISRKVS